MSTILSAYRSVCLSVHSAGERMSAQDAERAGLVSKVFPVSELVNEAVKLGERIGQFSQIAIAMCKEAVNMSAELPLTHGLRYEKKLFHASFATNDKREGMTAFLEKRKPEFTDS